MKNNKSPNHALIALCSAAVICVTGISVTEPVHANTTASAHAYTQKSSGTKTPVKKSSAKKSGTKTTATTHKTKKTQPVVKQKYKDGTYTGVGQTRIGAVQVAVTLKKDKITSAKITNYTTHYSISYIDPILPQELLQRQDPSKIDVVSGATLSTYDFYYAVEDALQQAQKAMKSPTSSTGK